jgi:glyoxylase-like metal-dependent hydrolase (beta-lactamase superfamily II)
MVVKTMHISDHCYAVTGLGLTPPWCVNAGFIAGVHTTLIADTGANALAAATIHGYATAVRASNGLTVVNLEKHFDHIGGNSFFRARGIDIFGHPGIQRTEEEFAAEIEEFNSAIPNLARRRRQEAAAFYSGTELANPNRSIAGDTTIELGECTAEILLTPGHTGTNLSIHVPGDRVLFCGDCLVNGYLPNLDAGTAEDWRKWLASLDRLAALRPRVVVPGHGHPAAGEDVAPLFDRVRKTLEAAIASGRSPTAPA